MPFDPQGNFTRVMNWQDDAANSIPIVASRHDDEDDNFAQGLSNTLCRDGRAAMTGNLKMGSFKITGLGNGTTNNDAINKSQLDSVQTTLNSSITNLSNNAVKITGNQSIAGTKTFTDNLYLMKSNDDGYIIKKSNGDITTSPSSNLNGAFRVVDKNNLIMGDIRFVRSTSGTQTSSLTVKNKVTGTQVDGALSVAVDASGNIYTAAPTPATSDNSTKIATTAYVKAQNYALNNAVVKLSGNQTVAGTKTFSSSPIVPTQSTSDDSTKAANTAYVHDVLEALYPVGSIYIGTQATCPLSSLISGSTWTKIAGDKVLQSSSSSHAANTTINAGLPNITGSLITLQNGINDPTNDGALYTTRGSTYTHTSTTTSDGCTAINFDASRSNSIYGNSTTVQPPAYVVNVWRRTA